MRYEEKVMDGMVCVGRPVDKMGCHSFAFVEIQENLAQVLLMALVVLL